MPNEVCLSNGELDPCPLLLLVMDGTPQPRALETNLLDAGYLVTTAQTQREALQMMFQLKPDFVIDGLNVMAQPGTDLIELHAIVRRSVAPPPLP